MSGIFLTVEQHTKAVLRLRVKIERLEAENERLREVMRLAWHFASLAVYSADPESESEHQTLRDALYVAIDEAKKNVMGE